MKDKKCTCKKDIKMSVPEGMEFNTAYEIPNDTMDSTLHSKYYYDYNRNQNDQFYLDYDMKNKTFSDNIDIIISQITDLLKEKNKAYGNTALNPTNVFSKLNSTEAICARIDDKLARIKNKGITDETEDTVDDLIGYLLLLKMSL